MALPFADQVASTTVNFLESDAEDNIYGDAPTWYHLKATDQIVVHGGYDLQGDIMYQKIAAGGSFEGDDLLNTSPTDTDTAWKTTMKLYYVHTVVTKQDLLRNSGDEAKVDLLQSKTKNAHLKMADLLSTDLFSTNGDSATGLTGLRNLASTTTTHHSIDDADFSNWKADVDASSSAIALSTLEEGYLDGSIGEDAADIIFTNKAVYKKLWALLQANQRFGGELTAPGGFKYLLFNDVPIFHDSHSPGTGSGTADNWLWMLNTRHTVLYVHKDDNMSVEKIAPPANQAIQIHRLGFTGSFVCKNRRTVAAFSVLKP